MSWFCSTWEWLCLRWVFITDWTEAERYSWLSVSNGWKVSQWAINKYNTAVLFVLIFTCFIKIRNGLLCHFEVACIKKRFFLDLANQWSVNQTFLISSVCFIGVGYQIISLKERLIPTTNHQNANFRSVWNARLLFLFLIFLWWERPFRVTWETKREINNSLRPIIY